MKVATCLGIQVLIALVLSLIACNHTTSKPSPTGRWETSDGSWVIQISKPNTISLTLRVNLKSDIATRTGIWTITKPGHLSVEFQDSPGKIYDLEWKEEQLVTEPKFLLELGALSDAAVGMVKFTRMK